MMAGETLRGDGATKATSVKRQLVLLKKEELKDIKDEAGVKDWKDGNNIAGDRGASWMDGRFLQSNFTGTRVCGRQSRCQLWRCRRSVRLARR